MVGKLPASTSEMHDKTLPPHHIKSEPPESFTPDFTDYVPMTSLEPMATGRSGLHQGGFHDDSDSDSEAEGSTLANSRKRKMAAVTVKEETMEPAKPRLENFARVGGKNQDGFRFTSVPTSVSQLKAYN